MKHVLGTIARQYGTPCFVYFMDEVYRRIAILRQVFGKRFTISYAVKANPHPEILQRLRDKVEMLDVSSAGELDLALTSGWQARRISFTGPGKREWELTAAVESRIGEVVVECCREAEMLDRLVEKDGASGPQHVLIRIAPKNLPRGFGINMAGKPCQFGIEEEDLAESIERIKRLSNLELGGFHIYSGTQCLDAKSIAENYLIFLDLFKRFATGHELRPQKLIFGSGIGIPYHEGDQSADLDTVATRVNPAVDALRADPRFSEAVCVLETGRYLVGEAGIYLTRVLHVKHSRGADIGICDGGMNHHLGACGHLGSVIHRNYRMFKVASERPDAEPRPYDLVGPLCTSIDTLGHGVKFPGLAAGDLVGVHCSGAYGLTASPVNFIAHELPREITVETRNGRTVLEDITRDSRVQPTVP